MPRSYSPCSPSVCLTILCGLIFLSPLAANAEELSGDLSSPALFTSSPTILLRTPNPLKLAEFYEALGMKIARVTEGGGVVIKLEGDYGSLEIAHMDPNTKPAGPKATRTQQGVVVIFETTDQAEVVRRAKAAGSPLIERWNSSTRGHSIYYIADPENNIFGFAPRFHNPTIKVP
jgi:predicted enzyme related to lactoylglutathione lyase